MADALSVDAFLARAARVPVIDVRTPAEFAQGHLPGAVNVPLFSDAERAEVGTAYKHAGRRAAVHIGLAHVAPRMNDLAGRIFALADPAGGEVLVHCWRGGMRSGGVAWLMEAFGCRVATLAGGYKAFRRWALESFAARRELEVLGGLTGCGKTAVLQQLRARGTQVVDLEALARHKGSVFGNLGEEPQPSQQQFENELALAWRATDPARPVWLEDESRMIGRLVLPEALWRQKQAGRFHILELPVDHRVPALCRIYAGFPADQLTARIAAIGRRLGAERTRAAIEAIHAGRLAEACRLALDYYDRTYQKSIDALPPERVRRLAAADPDPAALAAALDRPAGA